jgi:hypothetical protein
MPTHKMMLIDPVMLYVPTPPTLLAIQVITMLLMVYHPVVYQFAPITQHSNYLAIRVNVFLYAPLALGVTL